MPKINLLTKQVSELIAAGEVVERPASVIKELIENSIDAGATVITAEIQHGGIAYIRITDNGCGISNSDVPLAFLRHATSKISSDSDLNSIATLGFRGEALAAVSSVARVEMFTKTDEEPFGTHYKIEGGEELLNEETGCPDGTTIIIRDIFYNTPARMKFLKKDVSEANAAASVIERTALSHPEISFKLIRDGKQTLNTSGDGKTESVVYSVLGREFAQTLIPAKGAYDRIEVAGLVCKPVSCRPTRNNQFTFINGRLVRSGTVSAAAEQAYKNSAMVGKFPAFVLYINVPFDTVDVNIHPAKTEVRFSDERRIFEAVYSTIKNALNKGDVRPEIKLNAPAFNPYQRMKTDEYKQQAIPTAEKREPTVAENIYKENIKKPYNTVLRDKSVPPFMYNYSTVGKNGEEVPPNFNAPVKQVKPLAEVPKTEEPVTPQEKINVDVEVDIEADAEKLPIIIIGEAFSTYIIAQMGSSIYMIDKHAAHERILFNKLVSNAETEVQALIAPAAVTLTAEEYDTVINNIPIIIKSGFEIEDFGNRTVLVRTVPATLTKEDIPSLISELAAALQKTGIPQIEREENLYHTVACRAAIKAGSNTSRPEMQQLAERVLYSSDIMYCPHGRPVAFEIKKYELEKQFGRIQ